jgi:hypothetical protein
VVYADLQGDDRRCRRTFELVPITQLVDTFHHHADDENPSLVHPVDLAKAAFGRGIFSDTEWVTDTGGVRGAAA